MHGNNTYNMLNTHGMENGTKGNKEKTLDDKVNNSIKINKYINTQMTPLTCHILRGEDTAEGRAWGLLHWTDLLCSIKGMIVRTKADHITNSEAGPLTGFHLVIGTIAR